MNPDQINPSRLPTPELAQAPAPTQELAQAQTQVPTPAPTPTPAPAPAQMPTQELIQAPAQMPGPGVPVQAPAQAAPADPAALLEMLRDIQLPAAVPWWPPAPGWWLLFSVALLAWLGWRYEWRAKWRRPAHSAPMLSAQAVALAEFARTRSAFAENGDVGALVASLSALLRRVAMEFASRDETAALTGEPWLAWLDARTGSEVFSAGPGRVLADAPYRAPADVAATVDGEALLQVCEECIATMFKIESRGGAA